MQPTLFEIETAKPQPGEIVFTVFGIAQPAGSKSSFVPIDKRNGQPFKKNGRVIVNTVDANPKAKDWKQLVGLAARQHYHGDLLDGPIELVLRFFRPRNKGDFGSGRNAGVLKSSAPHWPAVKPDVLKLARGVEDALTGIAWRDDAQIVREFLEKRYGEPARVEILIRQL